MSLANCLIKHHAILKDFDTSEIKAAALAYANQGMSQQEAERQAIDDKLAEVAAERARIEKDVIAQYRAMQPGAASGQAAQSKKVIEKAAQGAFDFEAPAAQNKSETPNDATSQTDQTADNPGLDAGKPASGVRAPQSIRGAGSRGGRNGRSDGTGVRGKGNGPDGSNDASGDMGDGGRAGDVPVRAPKPVVQRPRRVSSDDYRPGVGSLKREGSWLDTARRNVDLIELAIKIEKEGRKATKEEQAQLAKYVGFGASAIRNELFPVPSTYARDRDPERKIWPSLISSPGFKEVAERLEKLPPDWQESVLQSTQYAHYTSEGVVRSIWSAMEKLGFTGGKIIEPGSGTGNFAMLMPESVHQTSDYHGIEFDGPTALIARLLSPDQKMLHADFIKRKFPKNYYDVAIGNPPFSQTVILEDPEYAKKGFMLHDFFFAKSIDRVRPGGLLAFVTSKGTMDKRNDKARMYLSEQADLIGAVRLPSTAFEDNAGTSVVTDVLFLRKRLPGEAPKGPAWGDTATVETKDGPVVINQYFAEHPEMVLGQNRISGNVDDMGRRINSNGRGGQKYTVVSYDSKPEELDAKFAKAVENLPANVYSPMQQDPESIRRETLKLDFDPKILREGVIYEDDEGELRRVSEGAGVPLASEVKLSDKDKEWLRGYVELRELVQEHRHTQLQDGDWAKSLAALNKAYTAFVKKHGNILAFTTYMQKEKDDDGNETKVERRRFTNKRLFREDYDQSIVTTLENIDESGEIVKSKIMLGRTIGKPVVRDVKSIGDALAVSLDTIGSLDLVDIGRRLGLTKEEAIEALGDQVYQTPQGEWQLADEYLSGNVVVKLEEAIVAAGDNPDLKRNVEALKKVQPEKLGPSQISARLGAPWLPLDGVNEFADLVGAGRVTFDDRTESWQVDGGNKRSKTERSASNDYGTARRSPSELLESALNSRKVEIHYDKATARVAGDEKLAGKIDKKSTDAANEVVKKIKDKFRGWIWTDAERSARMLEAYNARYNNLAGRMFDGSHLSLPGVNPTFVKNVHAHVKRAVWRMIQTGNTYLAHAVGAGKTAEMVMGGMEMKRLGLINKPMYVVPNHMLEQFSNEFMELYPLANIMVADDQNFSAERRRAFVAAATLNDPDAIVITHSAFERIGVKEESVAPIRDKLIRELELALEETANDNDQRVRRAQLEQQIEAVKQRFAKVINAGGKDSTIKFEDMGVDFVFADEAHTYRKLDFHTADAVKGVDPKGSQRSLDMYVKTRYLESKRPGRSLVFASGTPVTNTMGELYTIMRFFQPERMEEDGISTFDSWARMFGESVAALEPNAAGNFEVVSRFAKFDNVPELMSRVREFMDVITFENLGALVKRPDLKGGKPQLTVVKANEDLEVYQKTTLKDRLDTSKAWKPSFAEKYNPDPIVSIITDGRFAAIDPRFFGGKLRKGEESILTTMATNVARDYKATAKNVYLAKDGKPMPVKGGTQVVFFNLGFGASAAANRGFDARKLFTAELVSKGIKRSDIAWFDDANTDAKKEAIFKAMRAGTIRVLIGSAKKMGTGVNVQNRLAKLHYMDPPWFPADVEQPHGRILRYGNQNAEVGIEWYSTEGTYQSTMWQMVARKQRFINQAFSGDRSMRSMEDMSEASQFEQAAAVTSGDPRVLKLAGLRQDMERYERLAAAHHGEQASMASELKYARMYSEGAQGAIARFASAFKSIGERYVYFDDATVGGRKYDKNGEYGQALKDAFNREAANAVTNPMKAPREIAKMGATPVMIMPELKRDKSPTGSYWLSVKVGDLELSLGDPVPGMTAEVDAGGLTRRVINAINSVDQKLREARAEAEEQKIKITRITKKLGAPFEYQQEMLDKQAELATLEAELTAEGKAAGQAAKQQVEENPNIPADVPSPNMEAWENEGGRALYSRKESIYTRLRKYGKGVASLEDAFKALSNGDRVFVGHEMAEERPTEVRSVDDFMGYAADQVIVLSQFAPGGEALLSRSRKAGGILQSDAEAAADVITKNWQNAPKINVVAIDNAPKELQAQIDKDGARGDARGAWYQGQIYVFPENIADLAEFERTIVHEARHYGLEGQFGKDLNPILMEIFMKDAGVRKSANEIAKKYGYSTVTAVNEVLADMPLDAAKKLPGWKKLVAKVKAWLESHGFTNLAKLFEGPQADEITKDILYQVEQFVKTGKRSDTTLTTTLFSRADQVMSDAFKRWFGDSKVVDENGKPLILYHATASDFAKFKAGGDNEHMSGRAIWLTNKPDNIPAAHNVGGEGWYKDGANVMPLYASIQNPLMASDSDREGLKKLRSEYGANFPMMIPREQAYKIMDDGYDGVIFDGDHNGREYVVFDSTQLKSAIGNNGDFDGTNPDIRYSRPVSTGNKVLDSALGKAGLIRDRRNFAEKMSDYLKGGTLKQDLAAAAEEAKMGLFDQFHGIKRAEQALNLPAEQSAYVAARFSTGVSSIMSAMMTKGAPKWDQGFLSYEQGSKGLLEILDPVKENVDRWIAWMVGNRASRLMAAGKENNFTQDEIDALIAEGKGHETEFAAVAKEFAAYKRKVLDVAEQAGLLDAATRPMWDQADWIPFYRMTEEDVAGPGGKRGLAGQTSGIRALKGGKQSLNDPLENIIMNFSHLMDASLKNAAMLKAADNFKGLGIMTKEGPAHVKALIPLAQIKSVLLAQGVNPSIVQSIPTAALQGIQKMWSVTAPTDPDVVRVMRGGKTEYYRVSDPMLLRSFTSIHEGSVGKSALLTIMRRFKRVFTGAITATPSFMAANFMRDIQQAWVIDKNGFVPVVDSFRGLAKSLKGDGGAKDMMFAGASFMGGYMSTNDPEALAGHIRRALREKGYDAASTNKFMATVIDTPMKWFEKYEAIGSAIENANREAVYEAALKKGKSKVNAMYEAKDLMDYSMRGSWAVMQLMGDVLPFFNARMQGLYKLGREGAINPKMIAMRGMVITLATLALAGANAGDDWYEELEEWDKDAFWHFKIMGKHFRMPKGFEIGAIFGTIPERFARLVAGKDDAGVFGSRLASAALDTFAMNPIPQAFKPVVDVYANKNSFTGRAIEGMADEGKLPEARYNENTSPAMRLLTESVPSIVNATGMSPKRLEYLWSGYLGGVGMTALTTLDAATRVATGAPDRPASRTDDIPVLRVFYRDDPARNTRWKTELYDLHRQAEETYRTLSEYAKEGKDDKVTELVSREGKKLAARDALKAGSDAMGEIRKAMDEVMRSKDMTREEKRAALDQLTAQQNDVAKSVAPEARRAMR